MIVTSNNINKIIWVVCGNCEVLPWGNHLFRISDFAFVVDHVAAITCRWLVALKTAHQEELVVRDVDALEVVRDFVLGDVLFVVELQFLEFACLFDVVERLQLVGVESD